MKVRAFLVVVSVVLLAGCDWSVFGFGPDHLDANPTESWISPANASRLVQKWAVPNDPGSGAPVESHGVVYDTSSSAIRAFRASTGASLWSTPFGTGRGGTPPSVVDGIVYTGSGSRLDAFDASTGDMLWSQPTSDGAATPTVSGGVVYVATVDIGTSGLPTTLYAFDAKTGAPRWQQPIGTNGVVGNAWAPTVAEGKVFIGTNDGYVRTFDAETGEPGWATYFGSYQVDATVAVNIARSVVYVSVSGLGVFALDEHDGRVIWQRPVTTETDLRVGPIVSNPALSAGRLVVHVYLVRQDFSLANDVLALDATTGAVAWRSPAGFDQRISVANGVVYDGSLEGWDLRTGALVLGIGGLDSWVTISDGRVLGDGNGMLHSYGL